MRLKELHIRNIASIEWADIDFEHGLNDACTDQPASIFLISGDTGAGKSVILDGISMALYKTTPRIANVANTTKNNYIDAGGEQIRVASIEQYTRLGISEKDESYSEVVFEGNDGKEYHARLTLGMKRGNKDKETGLRPMKHRSPSWEIRVGNGDWTKDNVEQTIKEVVGLDFQQFGRMAMLAQGQFANFLTGDKKEREAILEQLTNTQHFTAYGEAINSLWKIAKDEQKTIQTQYDTEKPHTLSDEEVEMLTRQLQADFQQKETLDKKIKAQEDRLKLVEQVLLNESTQEKAREKIQELEAVVGGEEYQQNKMLFTDWDATTNQRQTLADLQKAIGEQQTAKDGLQASHDTFLKLSADIIDRQNKMKVLNDAITQTQEWINQHKQYDSLFASAGETDLKIGQYLAGLKKTEDTYSLLQEERTKTEPLKKAKEKAENQAADADKAVKVKEDEIETLSKKRTALDPQAINDQLSLTEDRRNSLEDLGKSYNTLLASQKEADELRNEIKAEEYKLAALRNSREKAESDYQTRKNESEKAEKLLMTMRMSVKDTLVNLRHRLQEEKADICPLCGQSIDHNHLDDDFKGILTPLEEEQKKAADALSSAIRRRDDSRDAFLKFDTARQGKVKQLGKADQKNDKDKQDLEKTVSKMGLDIREPLIPQIEKALVDVRADIVKLKASQTHVERLQEKINELLKEKKPLDDAKLKAEKAKTKAENDVKVNGEAILRLDMEYKDLQQECEEIKEDLNKQLSGYADDWQTETDVVRRRLKDDAKDYSAHNKQLTDDTNAYDRANTLVKLLLQNCESIIQSCPDWQVAEQPQAYYCRDINAEWTTLTGKVTTFTSKLKECEQTITASTAALNTYYQESGKTEQTLIQLIAKEKQVTSARKFVGDTDWTLKSQKETIDKAQKEIDAAYRQLDISDRSEFPDKQQLEDEKTATNNERDEVVSKMAQTQTRLDDYKKNFEKLKEIEAKLEEAKRRFVRWDKLNSIFGGTRFRTLVQTYILRPLLNNANIYLEQITDRYHLTCSEDNEQLSILVLDRYNKNQVRSVTVLSGGERFMISLALSLALSSLNRPDMNVNILFIDEGFGTLDEKSLDSVMQTLEKLQEIAGQTNRRVGIISHREELEERIPVKIQVVKKGEGRSMIEVTKV